jgi:hypothetical protein
MAGRATAISDVIRRTTVSLLHGIPKTTHLNGVRLDLSTPRIAATLVATKGEISLTFKVSKTTRAGPSIASVARRFASSEKQSRHPNHPMTYWPTVFVQR